MTPKAPATADSVRSLEKLAGALLLLLGLAVLSGCQGVSAGNTTQPVGTLSFANGSISFGNVVAGSSKTLTITASNTGSGTVNITSAAISTRYFTLTSPSLPASIAAGQSTTVSLTFSPNAAGAFNATMTIGSDASDAQTSVNLSGTGTTTAAGAVTTNPPSESFGSVADGTTQSQTVTLTNTGATSVNVSQVAVTGTGFQVSGITTPIALGASQSATFMVSFSPQTAGSATGMVTINSDASDSTLIMALSGTGVTPGALGSTPTQLDFGSVPVGVKQSLSETVTNTGSTSITISQVAASGTGFGVSGITTPATLTAGQTATFSVSLTPSAAGSVSGSVTVTSTASNPTLTIPLTATGIAPGALGSNPTSLTFGSVPVGANQTLSETVTNTGTSSVTISQVAASGTGFSISGITTPATVQGGQSATFSVSFAPTSAASASGSVTVTSTASNATLTIPLTGTGVAPGVLGANPTSLSFGNVQVGAKQTLTETITNTGGSTVTVSQVAVSGAGYSVSGITTPATLPTGQSATFSVSFTPALAGSASGNVTVMSTASNSTLKIPLSGTGVSPGVLGSNPTSLSFGTVTVGNTQTSSETVTNTGGSSVTISQVAASGTGFSLSGITTPMTLTAGQGTTFSVSFKPTTAAAASGSVTVTSNGSNPTLTIALSATGTNASGTLAVSPTPIAVGSVADGSSGTASGSLTASSANVTVTAVSSSNSVFTVTGLSLPVIITAGQSVPFTVTFSPTTAGAASATLTFTSNASPTTAQGTATGTGMAAATHTVSLSWTASTSTDISGYNIYRAVYTSSCGGFSKINPSLEGNTAYTDSSVVNGTSYCYAATAVDNNDVESSYSNIVTDVHIPAN